MISHESFFADVFGKQRIIMPSPELPSADKRGTQRNETAAKLIVSEK
jgi:hypothetical protein